jgi:hypothetical protein
MIKDLLKKSDLFILKDEWANEILKSNYENNLEFKKKLIELYRKLNFNPLWERYQEKVKIVTFNSVLIIH